MCNQVPDNIVILNAFQSLKIKRNLQKVEINQIYKYTPNNLGINSKSLRKSAWCY